MDVIQKKIQKKYKVEAKEIEHQKYTIEGVEVHFPYPLYECQKSYITSVLKALKNKENALLESPTGTGKTLCLLCASVSYLVNVLEKKGYFNENINISESTDSVKIDFNRDKKGGGGGGGGTATSSSVSFPKIIYASRTHSQLKQVIKELNNVYFIQNNERFNLLTTLLGSRDQLCVHSISHQFKGSTLNNMCKKVRQQGGCAFHAGSKNSEELKYLFKTPMDVESLTRAGKGNQIGGSVKFCPFYTTRELQKDCHIILLPYNYLFEESTRNILNLDLQNSIIIIDEGHNIESVAEEALSFKICESDLKAFLEAIQAVTTALDNSHDFDENIRNKVDMESLYTLSRNIHALLAWIRDQPLSNFGKVKLKNKHKIYEREEILKVFENNDINISRSNFEEKSSLMKGMCEILNAFLNDKKLSQSDISSVHKFIVVIENLHKWLGILFSKIVNDCIEYFQLYVTEEEASYPQGGDHGEKTQTSMKSFAKSKKKVQYDKGDSTVMKSISLLCFSATASLYGILKERVNSIVITSGTLSPIDSFSKQLSGKYFSFKNILENDHVIKSHQLFVGCINRYNNVNLLSTYENRSNINYLKALGQCILDLISCIPFGVLIFFSSYASMNDSIQAWKKLNLYNEINGTKKIFVEPNKACDLKPLLDQYENEIKQKKKGAIFMGVCRGKISEGIDFKDDSCRGVLICGLPYGNINDHKILLKKEFLNTFHDENTSEETQGGSGKNQNGGRGNEWYNEEAMRAINQSIGRVIRHREDYGAIVFLDSRFSSRNRINDISKWVRSRFRQYNDIEQAKSDMQRFFELFESMKKRVPDSQSSSGAYEQRDRLNEQPKPTGKNFQECFVVNDKKQKLKDESTNSRFVYTPPKKSQNVLFRSMIDTITKGNIGDNKSAEVEQKENNSEQKNTLLITKEVVETDNAGATNSVSKTLDHNKSNDSISKETKKEISRNMMNSFRELLTSEYYNQLVQLISQTRVDKNKEKYETFIKGVMEVMIRNFTHTQVQSDNEKSEILEEIMNEQQLNTIWQMLVELMNFVIPESDREKCFLIVKNRFKEETTNFKEMEKYTFNYRLNKIEIIFTD